MKLIDEIENEHGTNVLTILSDPFFLFPSMLKATNVEKIDNKYKVEIPIKGIFYLPFNLIIYVTRYTSINSVNYVVNVADFAEHRWGNIWFDIEDKKIKLNLDISLPLDFINSKILEKRVKEFKEKFNELIRIERIKRKI
ncbi:DUF3211 domain-containing protein [Acidianus infernus]|uniref:DUF3211 domain-containing protein n=2 Tax=Acidianus infernus TaxID=12915 RepID=A0A6A9QMF9_ACIIN|nr:STK_08120 family protein [Acidianus infernus]MUM65098.1 DUF3211 domain-containing protein [Acidianus infernus]